MKVEDVKLGMKVHLPESTKYTKIYNVLQLPQLKMGNYWVKLKCGCDLYVEVLLKNIKPYIEPKVEQPEFTWDKSVPTVGIWFNKNGSRFKEIDSNTPVVLKEPINVYDDNNFEFTLLAIVPKSEWPFVLLGGMRKGKHYIKLRQDNEMNELTVEQIEEKLGYKIKIVS